MTQGMVGTPPKVLRVPPISGRREPPSSAWRESQRSKLGRHPNTGGPHSSGGSHHSFYVQGVPKFVIILIWPVQQLVLFPINAFMVSYERVFYGGDFSLTGVAFAP